MLIQHLRSMDDLKPNDYSLPALENKKSFWVFLGCRNKIQSSTGSSAWKSSPVRFFGLFGQDRDQDRSIKTHTSRKTGPRPQKTAKSVFAVFLRSLDRSELVFVLKTVATNLYILC